MRLSEVILNSFFLSFSYLNRETEEEEEEVAVKCANTIKEKSDLDGCPRDEALPCGCSCVLRVVFKQHRSFQDEPTIL